MITPIPKQAISQLKKSLDNFKLDHVKSQCENEAQTRKFLIEPFFTMLNYQSNDLIPEFNADFGERISNKVDYAIRIGKKDILLIEAKKCGNKLADKEAGQLNGYFANTKNSRIAILTNGVEYKFFSDICDANIIDPKPFFCFDLAKYNESDIEALIKFDSRYINVPGIIKSAQEIVFNENFETTFLKELKAPSKDFLKIIHRNMTFATKFNEETQGRMIAQVNSSFLKSVYDRMLLHEATSNSQGVYTTELEIQAYHVIRTILIHNKKISKDRIGYRDFKGFFNISIDDSTKKVICKLVFTDSKMKLIIENKEYLLEHIDDLMKYKGELVSRAVALLE